MRDLTRLLKPKSIAVIGGGAWCASIVSAAEQIGFDGVLHPVHDQLSKNKKKWPMRILAAIDLL